MKPNLRTNVLIILLLSMVIYMTNISMSQANLQDNNSTNTEFNQQAYLDSMRALRAYRSSQHYKDSVAAWRQHARDSMVAARKHIQDSMASERKRLLDSMKAVRELQIAENRRILDSAREARQAELAIRKAEIQKRTDSLQALKKHRASKQYKDSVAFHRQQIRDSIVAVRKTHLDSMKAVQTAYRDSLMLEREKANQALRATIDSMKIERQRVMDSMATVRQARRDSLLAVKEKREADKILKQEEKEEKRKLQLQIDLQKERDAYTNEDMRKMNWKFPRSWLQNTFTRYNYWFNLNEKLKNIEYDVRNLHQDKTQELIPLYVVDPSLHPSQLAGEMDSIIQRASVGIQIHDPRSKWQDDLYLIVGKSYFYKGDYKNAQAAFRYVITLGEEIKNEYEKKYPKWEFDKNQFSMPERKNKHTPARNDAILWLARAMVADEETNKAMGLLQMVDNESQFPERLKGKLHFALADIYLKKGQIDRAIEPLQAIAEEKSVNKDDLIRVNFLLGQIFQEKNEILLANQYFKNIGNRRIPLDLDFYAKHNVFWNEFNLGENVAKAQDGLRKMVREEKFEQYAGLALMSLGKTYAIQNNYEEAIAQTESAINKAQDIKIKAEAQTLLGNYYYNIFNYPKALIAYEDALSNLDIVEQEDLHHLATHRSKALEDLVPNFLQLQETDSLKKLAGLSKEEQLQIVKQTIKQIDKERKDSIRQAELALLSDPALALNQRTSANRNSNFYFNSPQMIQNGLKKFKEEWGNRPLQDNWRRVSSRTLITDVNIDDSHNYDDDIDEYGLPTEEALLAKIPKTEAEILVLDQTIESLLFVIAKHYYTHIEDFQLAYNNFDRLVKEYPTTSHLAEAYYYMYLISARNESIGNAAKILDDMKKVVGVEHRFVKQIEQALARLEAPEEEHLQLEHEFIYEHLYELNIAGKYPQLLNEINNHREEQFNFREYEAHVDLLEILAQIGVNELDDAGVNIEIYLMKHAQKTDLIEIVKEIKKNLENMSASNNHDFIQSIHENYTNNPNDHYNLIIKLTNEAKSMVLKSGISDYNLMSHNYGSHAVSIQSFNNEENIIIINNFENLNSSKQYQKDLKKQQVLFKDLNSNEYSIIPVSDNNLQRLLYTKDWTAYEQYYKNHVNK